MYEVLIPHRAIAKKYIKVSNLYVNCRPTLTTFDYTIDIPKCNNGTRKGIPEEGKVQRTTGSSGHGFLFSWNPFYG